MSRILISGSSSGLGLMVTQLLVEHAHYIDSYASKQPSETLPRKPSVDVIAFSSINSSHLPIEGIRYE